MLIQEFIQTDPVIRRWFRPDAALLSTAPDGFDCQRLNSPTGHQMIGVTASKATHGPLAGWFSAGTGDTLLVGGLIRSDVYLLLGS